MPYELEIFHRDKQTMLAPSELETIHTLGKSPVISVTPAGGCTSFVLAESGYMAQYLTEHLPEGERLARSGNNQHAVPMVDSGAREDDAYGDSFRETLPRVPVRSVSRTKSL